MLIEITDQNIRGFGVWVGPGICVNGVEQTEGFIIDWSKGVVGQLPAGLQQYEVSFYTACRMSEYGCRTSEVSLVYVVLYAYSPSTEQGYVYLPGRDDELFKFNHAMWHGHGFEGNWLRATSAWEKFVRPLIARATEGAGRAVAELARINERSLRGRQAYPGHRRFIVGVIERASLKYARPIFKRSVQENEKKRL
ncbi:MAG: hypothetical protein DMG25_02825 [Acidobacteria bacterium]|nr:MAG: hypothetical protein DMG25_02825 [Acidobacteriota bacterium]PYV28838.1 MAG: hypothetical protein DMG27_00025 [Acidobacteriota bacterium]